MDQILTEQDLAVKWDEISPHRWCLIVTRARALLVQRDALKAERDEAIRERDEAREHCSLMAGERDTLAARVKELEGRVKDIVPCVPGTCPLNVEATSALHTAHEDGIRAGVSFVRRVLMDVGPVGTMTRVDKELDKLLRGATPMTHDAYATFDGNGRLDCLFHKDGPMPPEAEFVIVVRKNRPSLRLPDPDPRDAEIRALKDELARVTAERDGIIAQAKETYTNFGVLCDIRDVLKTTKFGDNLVAAIKAMKEELDQARKDTEPDPNPVPPVGHMIHIPAEYCGDSSRMHAYAYGYLAGKGAK